MPVLCDFKQIIGDDSQAIPVTAGAAEVPLPDFGTGGREANETALLIYSVRNMTGTAQVFINGHHVGNITASSGAVWSTQLIAVSGNSIRDGMNEIVLKNVTDAFSIKNLTCFFHQSS